VDHRHQVARNHEDGPPHAEDAHERPVLVQRALDGGELRLAQPGRRGQVDRGGVGGMQRHHRVRDIGGGGGSRLAGQPVADRQARPPLSDADAT
jgi:hypothetical protein